MAYKFRVILDVEEDVFRDIIVEKNINLEELHFTIAKSFGFKGQEMASFYKTNKNWEQGDEIPLFDMSEDGDAETMQNFQITDIFKHKGDKLIYIYDFMSMWSFFVELSEITSAKTDNLPLISLSFGNVPDKAPEKKFKSENTDDLLYGDDDFDDFSDEDNFESLDDIDPDSFY
jgi:hypothetical protein